MISCDRFDFVCRKSYEFLLSIGASSLPINPFEAIRKKHWGLTTYTELCAMVPGNVTVNDIAEACKSRDGFTVYSGGNYCIAYNDTVRVRNRIRFTLMHEAGHIICGHFNGGITDINQYRELESEANLFASNVLAPAAVIKACRLCTPEQLMAACGLSYNAAKVRLEQIMSIKQHPLDSKILKAFESYINICNRRIDIGSADICLDSSAV